jgi:hypothetical protein
MRILHCTFLVLLILLLSNCRQQDAALPEPSGPNVAQTNVHLIADQVNGKEILVVGESNLQFYTAFEKPVGGGSSLEFFAVQDRLPIVLSDSKGNQYDTWGLAVAGPDAEMQLTPVVNMMAYWFAWGALYPGCELYGHPGIIAPDPPPGDNDWLIPYSRLQQGALPGAIPSIDEPVYLDREIEYMPYLDDTTLCLVLKAGDKVFAYPHPVLEWHEVVNDRQAGVPFSVMYCPLTGSGNVWLRELSGTELEFEVSGLLYNGNLIVKERKTDSYWSQMRHLAVFGKQIGSAAVNFQVMEMPLASVRKLFGRFKLLSDITKFKYDYGNFPCGDYCYNHDLILYDLDFDDPRVPRKERTFGVLVDGKAKVYRQAAFK